MDFGIEKYICQDDATKNLWWSEPLQVISVSSGATQVATINCGEYGAQGILISNIILSSGIVAGAANLVTFTANVGGDLFVMNSSRDANGPVDIRKFIRGAEFTITATFAVAIVITEYRFTVQYQYLTEMNKTKFGFQPHKG